MRRGVVRWSAVLLLSSLVGAAAQDDADGAAVSVDEGEEESSTNSNIAKAVEVSKPVSSVLKSRMFSPDSYGQATYIKIPQEATHVFLDSSRTSVFMSTERGGKAE